MRLWDKDDQQADVIEHSGVEHIIMIGSSRLTSLCIKLLQAHAPAFLFTGERRFEQAVHEAELLQQASGHPKTLE